MEKQRMEFRAQFIMEAVRANPYSPIEKILADAKAAEEFIFGKSGDE